MCSRCLAPSSLGKGGHASENDWYTRQPPRRHCEFNDWIIEGRALFDGLDELKKLSTATCDESLTRSRRRVKACENGRPS